MDFSFIIVSHNSQQFLEKCIASIRKNISNLSYEIILVQNDGKQSARTTYEKIIRIDLEKNYGFGHACNIGAGKAAGKILFFLNPDTEIISGDISEIVRKLSDESIAIAAPRLITPNGEIQRWSCGKKISPWNIITSNLGFAARQEFSNTETEVDWISGAAFAITKKIFYQAGGFDEKFFMYYEDVDLCLRLRARNKKIIVLPQLKVMHVGGQSYAENGKQKSNYYLSQNYYLQKHFGSNWAMLMRLVRKYLNKV